jgi:hypothetical protein
MDIGLLELSPVTLYQLGAAAVVSVLLLLLLASFMSRSRVFCQYLNQRRGRAGVRDYLIDLLIREDLADPSRVVTPDSKPDTSIFETK